MFSLFNFITKVRSSITIDDLKTSRYFCLYHFHKKNFKIQLENLTIERTNQLIPKRIHKKTKKEITDCVVIFLRFMCAESNHLDIKKFEIHFDRIVKKNIEKLIQGDF